MDQRVSIACDILRRGGLVAFPTETVYGLGADARSGPAVQRIFAAKGRPPGNPIIVHVSSVAMARTCAARWPQAAGRLAQQFWPGPLTLIVPRHQSIAPDVSAGLSTVGLRMPDHRLAIELIRRFDGPIAAPSANRSTHLSPTTAQHVQQELGDAVDMILDGGPCAVGIESTVLDLTVSPAAILRPGGVARSRIEAVIGPVRMDSATVSPDQASASPGRHERHYAPRTPAFRFAASQRLDVPSHARVAIVTIGRPIADAAAARSVVLPAEPAECARRLYAVLRELDLLGLEALYIEMPPDEPTWLAVLDRIRRATGPL